MTEELPDNTPAQQDDYHSIGAIDFDPEELRKPLPNQAPNPLLGVVDPPEEKVRVAVLKEAAGLITGDRESEYGTPQVNFQRIADLLNVVLASKLAPGEKISAGDAALIMLQVKIGRAANGYKHDTAVDIAGYAGLWAELNEI